MSQERQKVNTPQTKSPVSTTRRLATGRNIPCFSHSAGTMHFLGTTRPEAIIQRLQIAPQTFTQNDAIVLQRTIGNQATLQLLKQTGLMKEKPVQCEESQPIKQENRTGMPDDLKAGVESLSGFDLSDVRVHYNSDQPALLRALAYTQGRDIHVAPGQERYLPHEAWHVVQQAQGRVRPTFQMKWLGVEVNDNAGLEREAGEMGERALGVQFIKPFSPEIKNKLGRGTYPFITQVKASQVAIKKVSQVKNVNSLVQCVVKMGGFADPMVGVPAGPQNADLNLVLNHLSRNSSAQISAIENLNTPISFNTGVIDGVSLGVTIFEAFIGGIWRDLDDIRNPILPNYNVGLQLNYATNMRVQITIDHTLHNIPPGNNQITATLEHEINVHLIHFLPWLIKLRSGAYNGSQIRNQWRTTGIMGGLATPAQEHATFAAGFNRSYNRSVRGAYNALGGPIGGIPFQADVHNDMLFHNIGALPPYFPI
jgi:hypothetical protein